MYSTVDILYDITDARLLAAVQHELRYNIYPNEQEYIQDLLQKKCQDVGEIIFSGIHSDNVIILNPKGKGMDEYRIANVVTEIIDDIYTRNIINKYGKNSKFSKFKASQLFYIINMGDQIKIYI